MSVSGIGWVSQFPTSSKIDDLEPLFRSHVIKFLDALVSANINIQITATRRPPQRAYLMHYAWCVVNQNLNPSSIPAYEPQPGFTTPVDIQWQHKNAAGQPDIVASKAAANQMVQGYQIGNLRVAPSLASLHIRGEAIDMVLSWSGLVTVKDVRGNAILIKDPPRNGTNGSLIKVGATYGVIHLIDVQKDPPHWSINGH